MMMMNVLLTSLTLLFTLFEPAPGAATNRLVLAVEDDAAPWSQKDGTGYANDLVKALYAAVGVDVELEVLPYARCKRLAVNGAVAGCFNMAKIPELHDAILFSDTPLFTETIGYFQNLEHPLPVSREEDLTPDIVIGAVIGYEYTPLFYELKDAGFITVEETRSEDINLKKLAAGRVDAALLVYNETKPPCYLLAKAGVTGEVGLAFASGTLELHIGFSKTHPRGRWALGKYEEGMACIKSDGTYDRITKEWAAKAVAASERTAGGTAK